MPELLSATVVVDTREKDPFGLRGLESVRAKLDFGDYSLRGHEASFAVERKSAADFIGTMAVLANRRRFIREMLRMEEGGGHMVVLVEGSVSNIVMKTPLRSNMNPYRMLDSALAISHRFAVPFMFCASRAEAELTLVSALRGWLKVGEVR